MGETTSQIEAYIEDTREDLGANLEELERKVKSATDWKEHFRNNPSIMLGVAFGGGLLLAMMTASGKPRRSGPSANGHGRSGETWDRIKDALIGVAATRLTDMVSGVVPDLKQHFRRTEEKTSSVPR